MAYDLATKKHTARDWSIGAGFTTSTEDVDLRLQQLVTETNTLNDDITQIWFPKNKGNPENHAFVRAWIAWRDDTYRFTRSWKEGAFYKIHLAWNYYNNAGDRLRELPQWRSRYQELSGRKATAPTGIIPADAGTNLPTADSGTNWWKWGAVAGTGGLLALIFRHKIAGLTKLNPFTSEKIADLKQLNPFASKKEKTHAT